jgi:alpha-mannosidase
MESAAALNPGWMGEKQNESVDEGKLYRIENGPVRACIESIKKWGNSKFIVRTYIYRSYPRIDYDLEVHWLETGGDDKESPMLRAVFPLAIDDARFYCDVPFNVVERPGNGLINGDTIPFALAHHSDNPNTVEMNDGQEVPAQKWVDVNNGKDGLALLNKTRYGHSLHNNELRLTLMRSAGHPDLYPNLGKYSIQYSIYPHKGNWTEGVAVEGEDFNVPVYAAEPPSLSLVKEHATRAESASLISLDKKNVVLSGVKRSEDGKELIVRLYENEGKESGVTLVMPKGVQSVRRLNLIEQPLVSAETPKNDNGKLNFTIKPHEIVIIGLKY